MEALLRLLDLVKRELSAEDAHIRLGGEALDDPCLVVHELRPGYCVVVRFDEPPAEVEPPPPHELPLPKLPASIWPN